MEVILSRILRATLNLGNEKVAVLQRWPSKRVAVLRGFTVVRIKVEYQTPPSPLITLNSIPTMSVHTSTSVRQSTFVML